MESRVTGHNHVVVDEARSRLVSLAEAAETYPFLNVVDEYLAAAPLDDHIRALAIGALLRKGLNSVVEEFVRACPPESPKKGDFESCGEQISRLGSELVDWSTTDAAFASNLKSLSDRDGSGAVPAGVVEQAWRGCGGELTLHRTAAGHLLVRGRATDGRRLWLPAALDCSAVEALNLTSLKGTTPPPFLLDGVGMGYLVPRLLTASRGTFLNYSPAIFIIETNLRALALVLRLHEWVEGLGDERVYLFTGVSAWDDWSALMREDGGLPIPNPVTGLVRWPGSYDPPTERKLAELVESREKEYVGFEGRASAIYASRDAAFWAERYSRVGSGAALERSPLSCSDLSSHGEVDDTRHGTAATGGGRYTRGGVCSTTTENALRVLGITSRFTTFLQHSMGDWLAAFDRQGAVIKLLIEDKDHAMIPRHAYMEALAEFKPDVVLMIDHHRQEYGHRSVPNVPFVCWIQDHLLHLFSAKVGGNLGAFDFTIGQDFKPCVLEHGYPAEQFMPCQMAIDPGKFSPDPGSADGAGVVCDVVYVSHHSETPAELHQRVRKSGGDERGIRLIDAFYEEAMPLFCSGEFNSDYASPSVLDEMLRGVESKIGTHCVDPAVRDRLMELFILPLADRALRHTMLEWAADWADASGRVFHLYGRGWEKHPRLSRYARGTAGHGKHLGAIARGAAINLHGGRLEVFHQRVLEILCAGGFFMLRYKPTDFQWPFWEDLTDHLNVRGMDRPAKVALDQLPQSIAHHLRELARESGQRIPETLELTEKLLLELRIRQKMDRRYYYANLAFPGLADITFDSPESFAKRAEYFVEHREERKAIAAEMRRTVLDLFTYDSLVERLQKFLGDRLGVVAERERVGAGLAVE